MNIEELIKQYPDGIAYKISHNECAKFSNFLASVQLEKYKPRLPKLASFLVSALLQPEETTVTIAVSNIKTCCQYIQQNLASLILQELQNIQKHMKDNLNKAPNQILLVWKTLVAVLGTSLHRNRTAVNTLLIIPEKCFRSSTAAVQRNAFQAWKVLIDNFALDRECISHPKRLKLILQPMMSNKNKAEEVHLSRLDAWWRVAVRLQDKLHAEFEKVCVPLLRFAFQITTDSPGKHSPEVHIKKSSSPVPMEIPVSKALLLRSCEVLLRILEVPGQSLPVGLSSPRSLPELSAQQLNVAIAVSTISKNAPLILEVLKKALGFLQTHQPGSLLSQTIVQAMLLRMAALSKEKNKEETEALAHFIHFIHICVKENFTPSGLKLVDSVTKILSTKVLTSHCYHLPMTSTEILNGVPALGFLELLFSVPVFFKELASERFMSVFKRLLNAGIEETDFYLSFTQSVLNQLNELSDQKLLQPEDLEHIVTLWLYTAHTLWKKVQKTQEVNQGNQLEHDFSCLLAALMLPIRIQIVCQKSIQTKEVETSWDNLCRSFMRCAAMVNNTEANVSLQELCSETLTLLESKVKPSPKVLLWVSYTCSVIVAGTDFQSVNIQPVTAAVLGSLEVWRKRKQPLANVAPLVKLIAHVFKAVYEHYQDGNLNTKDRELLEQSLKLCFQHSRQLLTSVTLATATIQLMSILLPHIAPYYRKPPDGNKVSYHNKQLEQMMQSVTTTFLIHYKGTHSQETFETLCPLLEATLLHPHRLIQEKARSLWMATFVDLQNTLHFPQTFKDVLKKVHPALISGSQISSVDSSTSFEQPTVEAEVPRMPRRKANFVLDDEPKTFLSPKVTKAVESKKKKRQDLNEDSQEFVSITPSSTSGKRVLTEHQKEMKKHKSHIPALYSDLTQDTQTLESQMDESSSVQLSSMTEDKNKSQESVQMETGPSVEILEIVPVTNSIVGETASKRTEPDSRPSGKESSIPSSGALSKEGSRKGRRKVKTAVTSSDCNSDNYEVSRRVSVKEGKVPTTRRGKKGVINISPDSDDSELSRTDSPAPSSEMLSKEGKGSRRGKRGITSPDRSSDHSELSRTNSPVPVSSEMLSKEGKGSRKRAMKLMTSPERNSDDSQLSGTDSPVILPSSGVSSKEVRMPKKVKRDEKLGKLAVAVALTRVEPSSPVKKRGRKGGKNAEEVKKRKSGKGDQQESPKKKRTDVLLEEEQSVSSCDRLLNEIGEKSSSSIEIVAEVNKEPELMETLEVPSTIGEDVEENVPDEVAFQDVVQEAQEMPPSEIVVPEQTGADEGVADLEEEMNIDQREEDIEVVEQEVLKGDDELSGGVDTEMVPETQTDVIQDTEPCQVIDSVIENNASQVIAVTRKRKSASPVRSESNHTTTIVGSRWKQKGLKRKSDKRTIHASTVVVCNDENERTDIEKENNCAGTNDTKNTTVDDPEALQQSPRVTIKRLSLRTLSSPMSRSLRMVEAAMKRTDGQPPSPPSERSASVSPPLRKHVYSPMASPTSSILKVNSRDKPPSPPSVQKRVSFADNPVDKEVIIPIVPLAELPLHFHYDGRGDSKDTQGEDSLKSTLTEEELKDSEELEIDSEGPVYPHLIGCTHSAKSLLPHLTSSMWSRGLDKLLCSKNIRTVGDLSSLTFHEVQGLPFKAPKVKTLRTVLDKYHQKVLKMSASEDVNLHSPPLLSENNSDEELTDVPEPHKMKDDQQILENDEDVERKEDCTAQDVMIEAKQVEEAVVQEDEVVAQENKAVAQEDEAVAQEDEAVAQEDEAVAQEDEFIVQEDAFVLPQDGFVAQEDEMSATQELSLTQVPSGGLSALRNYDEDEEEEDQESPLPSMEQVMRDDSFLESSMLGNEPAKSTFPTEHLLPTADAKSTQTQPTFTVNKTTVEDIMSEDVAPMTLNTSQLSQLPNNIFYKLFNLVVSEASKRLPKL